MPADSPSSILSRAADLIRDTAAAATPGPWQACEPWRAGDDYPVYVQTVTTAGYPNSDVAGMSVMTEDDGLHGGIEIPNARWIALMSPAVAAWQEQILRNRAAVIQWAESWDQVADIPERHLAEHVIAVLGEKEETP